MYSAAPYTPYEIDVNKRVRHANEEHEQDVSVNFTQTPDILNDELEKKEESKMINLEEASASKKSDEPGAFSKFWNWATQLF
jgi:cell division protein FtsA